MIIWIVSVALTMQFIKVCSLSQVSSSTHRDTGNVEFRPAGEPVNLTVSVSVVHNITSKKLRLNVYWSPNTEDGGLTESYNIHIWPLNDSDSYCSTEPYYAFIDDKDSLSWQVPAADSIPGMLDSLRIIPGCSYSVRLEANPHDGKTFARTNIYVPECVGEVCSCRYASSLPAPKLMVQPIPRYPDSVNISWSLNHTHYVENITSFTVRAGPYLHGAIYNLSWTRNVNYTAKQNHAATLHSHYQEFLTTWMEYTASNKGIHMATARAMDSHQCSGPETQLFFFINDENLPMENEVAVRKKESPLNLLAVGCFLAVLSVTIVIFCKKFFWLIYRDKIPSIDKHCFFYKPVGTERIRVFRKHNSLQERNVLYVEKEILEARMRGDVDGYEISAGRLQFQRWIGQGAFGRVFLAQADTIHGIPGTRLVAVKTLNAGAENEQREEFLEEVGMLKHAGKHENVVSLLACVTIGPNLCIVMEYVPYGDLLNCLRRLRRQVDRGKPSVASALGTEEGGCATEIFINLCIYFKCSIGVTNFSRMSDAGYTSSGTTTSSLNSQNSVRAMSFDDTVSTDRRRLEIVLDHKELHNFALQISQGMAHLESKKITHRDLAARNILIDEKKTLKISDFGLSRRGIYLNTRKRKVPLRWLSLEAMRDSLYSTKSDVWAFAIVLWEIGTLGGLPYPTVSDYDLLRFLNEGHRLEKPDIVSDDLYRVMRVCWSEKTSDRPSFADLATYLGSKSGRHVYVDIVQDPNLPPTVQYANIEVNKNC